MLCLSFCWVSWGSKPWNLAVEMQQTAQKANSTSEVFPHSIIKEKRKPSLKALEKRGERLERNVFQTEPLIFMLECHVHDEYMDISSTQKSFALFLFKSGSFTAHVIVIGIIHGVT